MIESDRSRERSCLPLLLAESCDKSMPKQQRTTMKDVAQLAGVSIQTVSTVINNGHAVSDKTRARVLAAIRELDYQPDNIARSLRTGVTQTIALVVSDITNPFFATMASTVEDYAQTNGYSLMLYNTHSDVQRENEYIQMAVQRGIDGLLFVSTQDEMAGLEALQAANIPVVAIDRIPSGYEGPSVTLDNELTGRLVGEHLLDLGHIHCAHISGPMNLLLSHQRERGFHEAICERGLEPGPSIPGDDDWSGGSGYAAMKHLLQLVPRPTAVFAANDRMAIGVMRAIIEEGLRIPEDFSVVGVDDIELAALQTPSLTTVRQSLTDIATLGISILFDILAGRVPRNPQVVCKPTLVVRESTAGPPH
jgi:DNA-binding LacI/PurR family transcriptional regulator